MDYILYPAGTGADTAPLFLLPGEDRADALEARLRELTDRPFSLAAVPVEDWNRDLSPWAAPRVFKGEEDFGGGGDATLERLSTMLPRIRGELGAAEAPVYIAGYSLAGLLAAYALFRMPGLSGAVCCSASLWYPGFLEYAGERPLAVPHPSDALRETASAAFPQGKALRVYLSLGDKEKKSRNPVLAGVEDRTLALRDLLEGRGVGCVYVSEPGNHFQDPTGRMARGIARCLEGEA